MLLWLAACPVPAQTAAPEAPAEAAEEAPAIDELAEALADDFDFRIQVQAALALGRVADPAAIPPLVKALRDRHPLVRASAANSLAQVGDREALAALQAMQERDVTAQQAVEGAIQAIEVRLGITHPYVAPAWDQARLYVAVGDLADASDSGVAGLSELFRSSLVARLQRLGGTIVGTEARADPDVAANLGRYRSVKGLFLTGSITDVSVVHGAFSFGVQVKVSIVVLDYASQNVRGMLTGTATSEMMKDRETEATRVELREVSVRKAADAAVQSLNEQYPRW